MYGVFKFYDHKCMDLSVFDKNALGPLVLPESETSGGGLEKRAAKESQIIRRPVTIAGNLINLGVHFVHIIDRHWPAGTKIPGIFTSYFNTVFFDQD